MVVGVGATEGVAFVVVVTGNCIGAILQSLSL